MEMETETMRERVERLRIKADILLKKNKKSFVKDIYGNYYFCYIVFNGEEKLYIENFKGHRFEEGRKKEEIYWVDVIDVNEYVNKEGEK